MLSNENYAKLCSKFFCEKCNYYTSKKSSFDNHNNSMKHKKSININEKNANLCSLFVCQTCNKTYKDNSGLWRHKKKCAKKELDAEPEQSNEIQEMKEIMKYLMKENSEMKNMMLEQQNIMIAQNTSTQNMMMKVIENGTNNTTNNITSNTNSHNKAFNLNFFLNETCKDAMNIMDFVDSIKLQLSDLEGVGELGYVDGISNIIVKNLKELDVTQRPLHCTDKKRETMYIKDEDKWEKDEEKKKLHKVVRKVTCKNQNLIPMFKEKHPDCNTYHSKFSDQYNKIIIESMGGKGDNDYEKEEKIIKNISKQVTIDKEQVL
jgi:hypothetical protein